MHMFPSTKCDYLHKNRKSKGVPLESTILSLNSHFTVVKHAHLKASSGFLINNQF